MSIQISAINNSFLKEAANNANTNVKDDFIDEIEFNEFKTNADKVYDDHNCTNEEYKEIFGFTPDKTQSKEITFDPMKDYNSQKEWLEAKDLKSKINQNKERIEKVKSYLMQEEISAKEHGRFFNDKLTKTGDDAATAGLLGLFPGGLLGAYFVASAREASHNAYSAKVLNWEDKAFYAFKEKFQWGVAIAGGALVGLSLLTAGIIGNYNKRRTNNNDYQAKMRKDFQAEYERLTKEQEKLQQQLEKLQKAA